MPLRRKEPPRTPDDRVWSAHTSVHPRSTGSDLIAHSALPAETGPLWAPDRLSIWPVEGGRYGIDAHYQGNTGTERANVQRRRLQSAGLPASVRNDDEGALIRLGPVGPCRGLAGARGVSWTPCSGGPAVASRIQESPSDPDPDPPPPRLRSQSATCSATPPTWLPRLVTFSPMSRKAPRNRSA